MVKNNKKKFSAKGGSAFGGKSKEDIAKQELKGLEDLPLVGGLFKGLEKFIDLVEKVEEAGGEIKKQGEVRGLGKKEGPRGIYGFSVRTGIGGRPKVQTFGNIRSVEKKVGKKEVKVVETREPIVDVFDEKDHVLIVAELPGVSQNSIKLNLKGDILMLDAGSAKIKYSKEVLLPRPTSPGRSPGGRAARVDFESRQEKFKNGVLEIKIKKIK